MGNCFMPYSKRDQPRLLYYGYDWKIMSYNVVNETTYLPFDLNVCIFSLSLLHNKCQNFHLEALKQCVKHLNW